MKNIKPITLLLSGSSILGVLVFLFLLVWSFISGEFSIPLLILAPLFVAITSYFTFYFFIKYFITERLRILYRSIRKGKFGGKHMRNFKLSNDLIADAEVETRRWSDEQIAVISELKEQAEFRREFLGNLAHELKTPVFSIQGYILTLLEGGLEDESVNRNFLERASKATDRMSAILEDLDQLMKMEVNEIQLDLTHFNLKELVQDLFEDFEMRAKKKNITLKFARDYDPVYVHADKGKIGQVLTNLISNSISYGNKGGTTKVRFDTFDDIITVEVSDDGLGIDEAHLSRLFERFYRVEKSRNRNEGGSGLGLSIPKH
ncbi:MAG: sensor histidine kinase, partial [Flavobacteriales bacterium]|nr:sensor histidine kinase [Flavobacteriales bacterium]